MLSGGRDSVCLLDLAVRLLGAEAVTALHVNYGLRDGRRRGRGALRDALRAGSASSSRSSAPRRPEGPGNLQAWARDTRYAAAAGLALRRGGADRHRPHRRRPGRDDPLPAGLLAEPPGAARDESPRRQAWCGRCSRFTREQTTAYCEERGLRLARRPDATPSRPTPATGSATASRRRSPRSTRRPARNVLRTAELLRDEAEVLDALVDAELDGAGEAPRGTIALQRLAELPPALRRLVVQRLADRAAGRPVPGAARRADQVAALRRTGTRDARPRRRRRGRSSSGACSVPSAEHVEPSADGSLYLHCARWTEPAIGETLVSSEELQRRVAELGAEISRDYEGRDLVMVGVLKGAVLFLADLMRSLDVPCEIDFMAVSSYGSQTDSSGVVRILKDLDAPIEGRDVLIVEDIIDSGLTLQYLMRNLNARAAGLARGLRPADQARAPAGRPLAALRRLRDRRTASRSATASTTRSATATSTTSPRLDD